MAKNNDIDVFLIELNESIKKQNEYLKNISSDLQYAKAGGNARTLLLKVIVFILIISFPAVFNIVNKMNEQLITMFSITSEGGLTLNYWTSFIIVYGIAIYAIQTIYKEVSEMEIRVRHID